MRLLNRFFLDNKHNRLIQRISVLRNVSGILKPVSGTNVTTADLIFKSFHNKFNPFFIEQFHNKQANKIDWSLTGGLGHYPSQGIKI